MLSSQHMICGLGLAVRRVNLHELASDQVKLTRWWPTMLLIPAFSTPTFKAAGFTSFFGVDLFVTAVALAVAAAVLTMLKGTPVRLIGLVPLVVMVVFMIPGLVRPGLTEYAAQKPWLFLLGSVPLAIAVFIVCSDREQWQALLRIPVLVAILAVVLTMVTGAAEEGAVAADRLSLGGNTLGLAYTLGAGIVAAVLLFATGQWRFWISLPLLIVFVPTLLSIGSRGPVLGTVVTLAIALVMGVSMGLGERTVGRLLVMGGSLTVVVLAVLPFTSEVALDRIVGIVTGTSTVEDTARPQLWDTAVQLFESQPFVGVGVGGFADYYVGIDFIRYPHNLFFEMAAEFGLLGLLGLGVLLGMSYLALFRSRLTSGSLQTATMLTYWLVGLSMFSGDLLERQWLIWTAAGLACLGVGCVDPDPKHGSPARLPESRLLERQ